MGKRRRARELAVQVLFHLEFSIDDPNEAVDLIYDKFNSQKSIKSFSKELVSGICENKKELDKLISSASKNWRIDRMSYLDRSILRLATFEILFMKDIPPKVSMDEAVEIGKKFGSKDSGSFVNGLLDNIYNNLLQEGRLTKMDTDVPT